MNINQNPDRVVNELGYLVVRVSTALGAIPLENATVNIRGNTPETSGILYSLLSDRDGLTEKIALPTPPLSYSDAPGGDTPYSNWNIDVAMEGYIPVSYQNVSVYSSIVSVQPAMLVPMSERFRKTEIYNESNSPLL